MGDRRLNLQRALERLGVLMRIDARSDVYESDPVGYADQPRFWNMALRVRTDLPPLDLLREVKRLEVELGREPSFRMGPRSIDIDILMYADEVVDLPGLRIPHPGMMDRPFVLRPLLDLDPSLEHPVTGAGLADRLAEIAGDDTLVRLGSADEILRLHENAG